MKVVLYNSGGVIDIHDNLTGNISVDGNSVYWADGSGALEGINVSFILVDDTVNISVGDQVTPEIAALDKKDSHRLARLSNDDLIKNSNTALLALTELYEKLLAAGIKL